MRYARYHRKRRYYRFQLRKIFLASFLGILSTVIIIIIIMFQIRAGASDNNRSSDKITGFYIQPQDIVLKDKNQADIKIKVYITKENKIVEMGLEDYVRGVVAGEMPAEFSLEALKAQAVAARTYALAHMEQFGGTPYVKAKGADVSDTVECQVYLSKEDRMNGWPKDKQKEYWDKLTKAVTETEGEVITYNGVPIEAPYYFSTSSGKTEDSQNVFGYSEPYLKSVNSSGDEASQRYKSSKTINYNTLSSILKSKFTNFKIGSVQNLKNNISIKSRTEAGNVKEIKIGNITISGTQFRSLFKLNSANFTMTFRTGQIIINCKGYGHDVGMSQWGANAMAKMGSNYLAILKHYYTGVDIIKISDINFD